MIELQSTIACPKCGYRSTESMLSAFTRFPGHDATERAEKIDI